MAKNYEFYKGKKKKRNYAIIPIAILVCIVSFVVVAFYATQQYAVITKDGVSIELPLLADDDDTIVDESGNEQRVFEPVEANLVFDQADYSQIQAVAGENVSPVRAIFVSAQEMNETTILAYADRLSDGNALLLEMKPSTGQLLWPSNSSAAQSFGLNSNTEIANSIVRIVADLKERGVYLIAQISCCVDDIYSSRSTTVALRNPSGSNYINDTGAWLDPYNMDVRNYTVELAEELFAMGFDEVVLANVLHPTIEQVEGQEQQSLIYTTQMSTTPEPVNAVCGFAVYVAEQLRDRSGLLSIYCNSRIALARPDTDTGQEAALFMKLYDRVYLETDRSAYPYNVSDIEADVTIGNVHDRLVPVVINYLPDNSSWVYIEQEEEADD